MKKIFMAGAMLVASMASFAEGIETESDSSRVVDLHEVVI